MSSDGRLPAMAMLGEDRGMREIIKIGVPAVLESVVSVIVTSVDTKMLSALGTKEVSAVSFTSQPKLVVFALFFALGTTTSIFVAQALGKKDRAEANAVFHMTLKIALVLSLALGVLTWACADPIMHLCNRQADTVGLSITFFKIVMLFMVFQNVSVVLNAALRGMGETRVPLISGIVLSGVDVLANYLLIEGHLGFPRLEVAGDAIATVLGTVAACVVSGVYLLRYSEFLSLRGFFSNAGQRRELLGEIGSKAYKVVSENLLTRVGFLLSSIIVSTLGSAETAVYSVAMILLNYSFAFGDGLQAAAVTLVGRSMGAGAFKELRAYARKLQLLSIVVSAVLSVVYVAGARWFMGLFFSDSAAIELGISFCAIAAALTFLQVPRITNVGIMRGTGDVRTPMILATVCVLLVNPSVSYLLIIVLSFGIWGVWAASVTSQVLWLAGSIIKTRQLLKALPSGAQPTGAAR